MLINGKLAYTWDEQAKELWVFPGCDDPHQPVRDLPRQEAGVWNAGLWKSLIDLTNRENRRIEVVSWEV